MQHSAGLKSIAHSESITPRNWAAWQFHIVILRFKKVCGKGLSEPGGVGWAIVDQLTRASNRAQCSEDVARCFVHCNTMVDTALAGKKITTKSAVTLRRFLVEVRGHLHNLFVAAKLAEPPLISGPVEDILGRAAVLSAGSFFDAGWNSSGLIEANNSAYKAQGNKTGLTLETPSTRA